MFSLGISLWPAAIGRGTPSPYGPNLVGDPGFDNPAYWGFVSGGWAVTGSKATNTTGASGYVSKGSAAQIAGVTYKWEFTVSNRTAGSVMAYVGSSPVFGAAQAANGTFSGTVVGTAGGEFGLAGDLTGSVDDFSIKQVM